MLTVKELAEATGGKLIKPDPLEVRGFSIDSRSLSEGDFFIPLSGSRTDGHHFLGEAFEKGASGAFVRSKNYVESDFFNIILVEDTEAALLRAARSYRSRFDIPIVGVTGSWGKTTTKELIASVLSRSGEVHKAPGNYNTEYGLPLSFLEMEEGVDYGVYELGLQYPGDVETLSEVLSPTIGLITGVGKVHAENFKSVEDIAEEKLKLAKGMEPGSKILINGDSEPLRDEVRDILGYEFIEYGVEETGRSYYATDIEIKGTEGLAFLLNRATNSRTLDDHSGDFPLLLESSLASRAKVNNIIGASAITLEMETSLSDVKEGVQIKPLPQRLNPISFSGGILIDDTYNANPSATVNALELLVEIKSVENKFFVFGDMKELGENSPKYHRDLAPHIIRAGIDRLLAIGKFTKALVNELETLSSKSGSVCGEWFESREDLKSRLGELILGDDNLVLVKGSRSMKMEDFVDFLVNNPGHSR